MHPITRALSGTPPRTRQVAEASAPIRLGANGQRSSKELFRGVDQGADDESAESGIRIRVSIWVAVGFLAVVGVLLLPLSTKFGSVHDDRGLLNRIRERRNSLLARGRKRTFIRMFDYISMRATIAGAHDNLIGGTEFARHGVEGMRESGACHRVRQSHALTNDLVVVRAFDASTLSSSSRNSRMFLEGDSSLPSEGTMIVNYECKGSKSFADLQVLEGKICDFLVK